MAGRKLGTWHEKGRNHGRSPSGNGDLARKGPKSWKVPREGRHRRPARRRAGLLAVPGGDCGGLLGVPSSPPPTACPCSMGTCRGYLAWKTRRKNKARQFALPGLDFEEVILEADERTSHNKCSGHGVEYTDGTIGLDSNEIVSGGATGVLNLKALEGEGFVSAAKIDSCRA